VKGGARIRSGPPADPEALRRRRPSDRAEWIHISAPAAPLPPPAWPLVKPTKRERLLWQREWARPQAVMWRRLDQATEVALYVRTLAEAEKVDAAVSRRTLLRQQMDALGLTAPGLRALRWLIDPNEEPTADGDRQSNSLGQRSVRERLKLLDGTA
jgi:hypothetical protein